MRKHDTRPPDNNEDAVAALDRLRVLLDSAAIRRRMLHIDSLDLSLSGVAQNLGAAAPDIVTPTVVEADGDYLAVIGAGGTRIALTRVAELVGAKRVRLPGPRSLRTWLARFHTRVTADSASAALEWWEVPFITGLPTVLDLSLTTRRFLYASTGDPEWVARIAPEELRRATAAIVADVHGRRAPSSPG